MLDKSCLCLYEGTHRKKKPKRKGAYSTQARIRDEGHNGSRKRKDQKMTTNFVSLIALETTKTSIGREDAHFPRNLVQKKGSQSKRRRSLEKKNQKSKINRSCFPGDLVKHYGYEDKHCHFAIGTVRSGTHRYSIS